MFCRSLGFCNVEVEDWKAKGNQAYYLYTELSWTLTSHKIVLFLFSVWSCGAELHDHDNWIQYKVNKANADQYFRRNFNIDLSFWI